MRQVKAIDSQHFIMSDTLFGIKDIPWNEARGSR